MEGKWNCKQCSGSGWKNVAPDGEVRRVRRCECVDELNAEQRESDRLCGLIFQAKADECRRRGLSTLFDLDRVELTPLTKFVN